MRLYSFSLLLLLCSNLCSQSGFEQAGLLYGTYLAAKDSGNFLEAEAILKDILPLSDQLPAYNIATIYNSLGSIDWSLGKYQKAEQYYNRAIDYCTGSDLKSLFLLALIRNNQAILHKQTGELYTSLEYYQKAESVLARMDTQTMQYLDQLSMLYFNKALVLYKLRRYNEAIKLFLEAYQIRSSHNLSLLGSIYVNLARSYQELNQSALAEDYYQKSIDHWIWEYDSSYYALGSVYLAYGIFQMQHEKHGHGLELYLHALDSYLFNYGPRHTYTASCYNLLGDYFLEQGEYYSSLEYLQKALISICPGFKNRNVYSNPESEESLLDTRLLSIYRSKIHTLIAYANTAKDTDPDSAAFFLQAAQETNKEAVSVLQRIQLSYSNQESRLFLVENQKDLFIEAIEAAMLQHELSGEPRFLHEAYKYASMGKAMELNFEIREKESLYLESQKDSMSSALLDLKEDIDSYTNLIEMEQLESDPDPRKILDWKNSKFQLSRAYEQQHHRVFRDSVRSFGEGLDFDRDLVPDLQSRLHRNETVIEYCISNSDSAGFTRLFAFVISKHNCEVYRSILDRDVVNRIFQVYDYLADYNPLAYNPSLDSQLKENLHLLYEKLIEPVEPWITGSSLQIIPDDYLARIPFDALIKDGQSLESNAAETIYLIHEYEISYAPHASFIFRNKQPILGGRPKLKVIAYDYAVGSNVFEGRPYLSSVSREVESVLHIMKGSRIPADYSKKQLLQEIEKGELLHFALHSTASDVNHSSAFVAIDDSPDSAFNNLLFDFEIEALQISASLVVLNACESGNGKLYEGEGMQSLSRSFLLAGAESVTHTLWPVDDRASLRMITPFYEGISKGWSKSKSIREAKLNYLADSSPSFSSPFYWAGIQIVGNTSPLITRKTPILWGLVLIIGILMLLAYKNKFSTRPGEKNNFSSKTPTCKNQTSLSDTNENLHQHLLFQPSAGS